MKGRRLCGYDLNGWADRAARNWVLEPDGEVKPVDAHLTGRVLRPSVVRVEDQRSRQGFRWIGGEQASLAPHGRGTGWGQVGSPERRRLVLDLLKDDLTPPDQLSASLSGLASGADVAVVAIPEGRETTEVTQERLDLAIAKGRLGSCLLVWRSVLTVLATKGLSEGAVVGILGHVSGGFTFQTLKLRAVMTPKGRVIAPERKQAAQVLTSELGYAGLWERARASAAVAGRKRGDDWAIHSRAVAETALTGQARPEIIRSEGQDFLLVTPGGVSISSAPTVTSLPACDIVLFETLTEGPLREELVERLGKALSTELHLCPTEVVALGALEAARRHAQKLPVYFDFLPQISTIVLGRDGAENYDLIDAKETLPAGHIYRSPHPAHFKIQAGQSTVSVHILKELAPWPRKAGIDIGRPQHENVAVSLRVEQAPASGRARLLVDAPSLGRQFTLDWDSAEEIEKPWEDLIAELSDAGASIPKRLVLPCGMLAWEDPNGGSGLIDALKLNRQSIRPDWQDLARRLAARPRRTYAVSSDGEIPSVVPKSSIDDLEALNERALGIVRAQAAGATIHDNEPLKVLTWQFRRAPAEVPGLLLEAIEAHTSGRSHNFANHAASWVLVYQGFGRTCRDPGQEAAALEMILSARVEDWSFRRETAALAFLLSRSDTAPRHLERPDVEKIGRRILFEFGQEIGSQYTRFFYAPFLLGGLIRWRLKHRNALVLGQDPLADQLGKALERTTEDLTRRARRYPALRAVADRYVPLLENLKEELEGRGGNPDLLLALYDASRSGG